MVDPIVTDANRSYVDWPAIFAGAFIASGAMAVLTAFASGLGLSSISADNGGEISSVWLIITGLFVVISMVGSYMLGGYITGRMRRPAGQADRNELTVRDGLNGLVVWGIGTVVSAFLALGVISGGARAVGSAAQTAIEATGTAVGGAAQGVGQVAGESFQEPAVPLAVSRKGPGRQQRPASSRCFRRASGPIRSIILLIRCCERMDRQRRRRPIKPSVTTSGK